MELPQFVLADNSDAPERLFVIHLEFPRFIIDVSSDEEDNIEFLEELDPEDEKELEESMDDLIEEAFAFYEREILRIEEGE